MSNRIIPAEELTQYQRWEMSSILDDKKPRASTVAPVEETTEVSEVLAEEVVVEPALPMPTAEEIEAIHKAAFEDGYAAGMAEAADEIARRIRSLDDLIQNLDQHVTETELSLAEDLVSLAVRLAEQIVRQTLADQPAKLIPLIQEVIASSPYLGTQPRLLLNPEDLSLLRDTLQLELSGNQSWQLVADPKLQRGDCRLSAAEGEVDATLATRWQRVLAALGQA